jgi:hypothetical protein
MRAHGGAMTAATQRLLCTCALTVLILAILASLPFLFHVLNRGIDWINGFLPNPGRSWDRLLWLR